jgi:hypothetical protein
MLAGHSRTTAKQQPKQDQDAREPWYAHNTLFLGRGFRFDHNPVHVMESKGIAALHKNTPQFKCVQVFLAYLTSHVARTTFVTSKRLDHGLGEDNFKLHHFYAMYTCMYW